MTDLSRLGLDFDALDVLAPVGDALGAAHEFVSDLPERVTRQFDNDSALVSYLSSNEMTGVERSVYDYLKGSVGGFLERAKTGPVTDFLGGANDFLSKLPASVTRQFDNEGPVASAHEGLSGLPESITRQFDSDRSIGGAITSVADAAGDYLSNADGPFSGGGDSSAAEVGGGGGTDGGEGGGTDRPNVPIEHWGEIDDLVTDSRDADLGIVDDTEEFDPSYLEMQLAAFQKELAGARDRELAAANQLYDRQAALFNDDPNMAFMVENARQSAVAAIQDGFDSVSARAFGSYIRQYDEGKARWEQVQYERVTRELQNENLMLTNEKERIEILGALGGEEVGGFVPPSADQYLGAYNERSGNEDINESEGSMLAEMERLGQTFQYGVLAGMDNEGLTALRPLHLNPDAAEFLASLESLNDVDRQAALGMAEELRQAALAAIQGGEQ